MKNLPRAPDTRLQEQTVPLKSHSETMIVTSENLWQLPGTIWSCLFFFAHCDDILRLSTDVAGSFPTAKFHVLSKKSNNKYVVTNHRLTAAAVQICRFLLHVPGMAEPKRRGEQIGRVTAHAARGDGGRVCYLARGESPCCSHRRVRLQMLRHLRRAVEKPLAARPRCSFNDSRQTRRVGSAWGSRSSWKKKFSLWWSGREEKKRISLMESVGE